MRGKFKQIIFPLIITLVFTGILVFLSARELRNANTPTPVINEVCNNNFSCLNDGYGNYPSWVELYNPGGTPINLKNYGLCAALSRREWRLPDMVLEPGAFILLAQDIPSEGKGNKLKDEEAMKLEDLINEGANAFLRDKCFFNFPISRSGDEVYLVNSSGEICDRCGIPETGYDRVYARITDGGEEWREQLPTPGYSNNGAEGVSLPVYEEPVFSRESGFYEEEFELEIDSRGGGEIYYTLDGSEPDQSSLRYDKPIHIKDESGSYSLYASRDDLSAYTKFDVEEGKYVPEDKAVDKAVIVRAVSCDEEGRMSRVANGVFFIGYKDRTEYEGASIISLIADPEDLFGNERGIYVLGKEYEKFLESGETAEEPEKAGANYRVRGAVAEREAYLNYFDEEHNSVFGQRAGIRIRGGYSRTNEQKSINIFARDIYGGDGIFEGSFFGGEEYETSVSLFAGGQDNKFKYIDELFSRLMEGRNVAVVHSKPAFLFLNGEFWGIYWLQERYADYYFREHYNTAPNNSKALKLDYHTEDEELLDEKYVKIWEFIDSGQLYSDKVYKEFCELVDIDSLIEYYAANIYIAHVSDWPRSNLGIWRSLMVSRNNSYEDTRWRYYIFDVNSISMLEADHESLREAMGFDSLLRELFKNKSFREAFLNKFRELESTVFTPERVNGILSDLDRQMGSRLASTWERFFQSDWEEKRLRQYSESLRAFFEKRAGYIDGVVEEACLRYDDYMKGLF
ncbi:MAG: CotH kinase family protein [Lachnospiraceae bacterium]|nr:CotH kinase family protein [Lachnospiraceae bacterium]